MNLLWPLPPATAELEEPVEVDAFAVGGEEEAAQLTSELLGDRAESGSSTIHSVHTCINCHQTRFQKTFKGLFVVGVTSQTIMHVYCQLSFVVGDPGNKLRGMYYRTGCIACMTA